MSWKRYFQAVGKTDHKSMSPTVSQSNERAGAGTSSKLSSYLPEVYAGHPNRIQRYYQYDDMDRDADINAALDAIAEFCTQSEEQNQEPFDIYYTGEPNETEVSLLKTALSKWVKINKFRQRLFNIFRNTLKNGDSFFLRDPETGEWLWIDTFMVEMVKVDETSGKEPDEYLIRGLDYNKQAMFSTVAADPSQYRSPLGASNAAGARPQMSPGQAPSIFALAGTNTDPRQRALMYGIQDQLVVVDAEHVIHLSLSVGMDINWPFGASILEPVFKTYKQKELLEDSVIIYRVQRAPERRIFYIDTGSMPPPRAKAHIESIKNEIHQRRIPNRSGSSGSILDSSYSPLCLAMDTQIPLLDGRILTIEELSIEFQKGKINWTYSCDPMTGEIMKGNITWAGLTRTQEKVIKITLDNGHCVICTPDHKIPVLNNGFFEAQKLTITDNLIAFSRHNEKRIRHIVSIEDVAEPMDVGTLTIDFEERYHRHHTFALEAGIFVKNSMLDDYYFATSCIDLFTKIPLLDGRQLTLSEIIKESESGKINYVYSMNLETHEFEPGKITWAGITRRHTERLRVTLDNGEFIDVTPDHRFIKRDGNEIRAEHLVNDLLMPLHVSSLQVISVELLPDLQDTGDITVESKSNSHVFAVAAGVYIHNSDGRGSKVETLPGGEMTGEIGDLLFFAKKLARGLRIPTSYLPLGGEEEGAGTYNDGKLGAAMIQEFRFNKYCMRVQSLLAEKFDKSFKWYLRKKGIEIDEDLFELHFLPPQNFSKYRQIEVDAQQVSVYTQLAENRKLSERFKFKRFLNLSEDELLENEKLWKEENAAKFKKNTGAAPSEDTSDQGLSSVGVRSPDAFGDMGGEGMEAPPEEGGGEPPPDMGGGAPSPSPQGGEAPPPAPAPPPS